MTPLELWQAGGREPVVKPILPAELAYMPPWKWRRMGGYYATGYPGELAALAESWKRDSEDWQAAAEECRAALAAALFPDIDRLAPAIARDLFTNGAGQRAERLVLVRSGSAADLGGWGLTAATARIRKHLEEL